MKNLTPEKKLQKKVYNMIHSCIIRVRKQNKPKGEKEMNKLQVEYLKLKAEYDKAYQAEDWDAVEAVEDKFITAELKLVKWSLAEAVKAGAMTEETARFMYMESNGEQHNRLVELALKLKA